MLLRFSILHQPQPVVQKAAEGGPQYSCQNDYIVPVVSQTHK